MKIANNLLVAVDYKLFVKNEDGTMELMEETENGQPLKFFFGLGMMLPKFEENLSGLSTGDTFDFMIPCADAYGEYDEASVIDLPRKIFEIEGKIDEKGVYPGAIVPLVDSEGQRINAEVVEVKSDAVTVDLNHPLSGEDLYFKGTVLDVHEPTEEDLRAMSGGCGCGCDSCGGECNGGCNGGCC
ncbi:MAG: peptidylprolyl isomerase [Paludibacteraceae bacterium]